MAGSKTGRVMGANSGNKNGRFLTCDRGRYTHVVKRGFPVRDDYRFFIIFLILNCLFQSLLHELS